MTKYRYRLRCDQCGDDPDGCFDGGSQLSEEGFDSPEQADEAGSIVAGRVGPWEYQVTDENGHEVKGEA